MDVTDCLEDNTFGEPESKIDRADQQPSYHTWGPATLEAQGVGYREVGHWIVVAHRTSDSDAADSSNYLTIERLLCEGEVNYNEYAFHHKNYAWVKVLLVDPSDSKALIIAGDCLLRLEAYPVLDDDLCSELEKELGEE